MYLAFHIEKKMLYNMFFCSIFARFFKLRSIYIIQIMKKMKKLVLLVAIATTISFAACTNANSKEQSEETIAEGTELALDETSVVGDSTIVVEEMEADSLVESLD